VLARLAHTFPGVAAAVVCYWFVRSGSGRGRTWRRASDSFARASSRSSSPIVSPHQRSACRCRRTLVPGGVTMAGIDGLTCGFLFSSFLSICRSLHSVAAVCCRRVQMEPTSVQAEATHQVSGRAVRRRSVSGGVKRASQLSSRSSPSFASLFSAVLLRAPQVHEGAQEQLASHARRAQSAAAATTIADHRVMKPRSALFFHTF